MTAPVNIEDPAQSPDPAPTSRPRGPGAAAIRAAAVAYPLLLLGAVAGLRLCGERWWLSTVALYVPRAAFAAPLPFLIGGLLWLRAYRLLFTQAVAAWLVLFPLMGLVLAGPRAAAPGAPRYRIFTANIGLAADRIPELLASIHRANPDVVVLEEVGPDSAGPLRAGLPGYAFWSEGQFAIASLFPLEPAPTPPPPQRDERPRAPAYARCRLMTPAGPLRLYAVHPLSPHAAFDELRGKGLLAELLTGRIFNRRARQIVAANTARRLAPLRALIEDASGSPDPVLIAGDTNLPGLSWARATILGRFQDAFAEAGRGFGYTYPAQGVVWMRIDRVLGGPGLRFLAAAAVGARVHDHLPVTADFQLRPSP